MLHRKHVNKPPRRTYLDVANTLDFRLRQAVILSTAGYEDRFADVLPNLKERVECLKAVIAGTAEFESYKMTLDKIIADKAKAERKAEKAKEKNKAAGKEDEPAAQADAGVTEERKLPLHAAQWASLRCLETLKDELESLGAEATSATALAHEAEEWKTEGVEPVKNLVSGVKRLAAQVKASKGAIEAEILKMATSRQKAREKAQEAKGAAAASAKGPSLFTLEFDGIMKPVPETCAEVVDKLQDTPWVIQVSDSVVALLNSGEIRLNCMVFKAAFQKELKKRKDFKRITAVTTARSSLLRLAAGPETAGVTADVQKHLKLCGDGLETLQMIHVFGYKGTQPICGPELHCLGSLRATCEKSGNRLVVMVPFGDAQEAIQRFRTRSGDMTYTEMPTISETVTYIKTLTQESLAEFAKEVDVFHTICGQGSLLYTPPGYLLFEQCLGATVTGVVASLAPFSQSAVASLNSYKDRASFLFCFVFLRAGRRDKTLSCF